MRSESKAGVDRLRRIVVSIHLSLPAITAALAYRFWDLSLLASLPSLLSHWTVAARAVKTFVWMTRKYRHNAPLSNAQARRKHQPKRTSQRIRYRVALSSALQPGESMKFLLPIRGIDEECFVVNYEGGFHAYVNRCRHVPMAMDWVDNQFFAEHGRYLMCQTHNAYYQPDSGECIAGPPGTCGKSLYRVPLEIVDGVIYAHPPQQKFEDEE